MNKPHILLIEQNPQRQLGITKQASAQQFAVTVALDLNAYRNALRQNPSLILVNTDDTSGLWENILNTKEHRLTHPPLGVLGYSLKKNAVDRLDALDNGCDNVVSQNAIEKNLALQLSRHARPVDLQDIPRQLPAGIIEGIKLFNHRQFHPAHDAIEPVWLAEKRGIRLLYAGILQIGIAYHFIEHQGYAQALRMFGHGRAKLVHFFPNMLSIGVEDLYQKATASFYKLKSLGPNNISHVPPDLFPTIQFPLAS